MGDVEVYVLVSKLLHGLSSVKMFECAYRGFEVSKSRWFHAIQSVYHVILPVQRYILKAV